MTKSDSFDAFINALITYTNISSHVLPPRDDDDDDAKYDDFFLKIVSFVREYEAQSFITPTKECAEQKPNNDHKGGRERGQNRRYYYPSPGRSERFKTTRHNLSVDHADFTNVRG